MTGADNAGEIKFSALLEQIEKCVNLELYYVAIMTCLAIPDIAGALESDNGWATETKYIHWVDEYFVPKYQVYGENYLTGGICYSLRCAMLHQGKTELCQGKKEHEEYSDIVFRKFPQIDSPVCSYHLTKNKELLIEPKTFCHNMIYAAYDWLEIVHDKELFMKNINKFIPFLSLSFPGLKE